MIERKQRHFQALPLRFAAGKAETHVVRPFVEDADQNATLAKMPEQCCGALVPDQREQGRAAGDFQPHFFSRSFMRRASFVS